MKYKKSTRNLIDLFVQLVKTSFKMRYQNSVLGILWVLIKPYTTFIVLFLIWSKLGRAKTEDYQLYLLVGIIFYGYFSELIKFGQMALLDRSNIILKVSFPRYIALMSSLAGAIINLGINMVLVIVIMIGQQQQLTIVGIFSFIFITLLTFVFTLAISYFLSILTVRLRDLQNIVDLGLFLLYWATPIFFVIDDTISEGRIVDLMLASPVAIVLNQARVALGIGTEAINLQLMLVYFAVSIILCFVGSIYFNRNVKRVAEFF